MITINKKRSPPGVVERFADAFMELAGKQSAVSIESIALTGSHSMHLENSRSDYDVHITYSFPIEHTLSVEPTTLTINWPEDQIRQHRDENGKVLKSSWLFEGEEFEPNFFPLFAISGNRRNLIASLYHGNAKYLIDTLQNLPVIESEIVADLKRFLTTEFKIDLNAVSKYCTGYAKSQFLRNRRRSDFRRRVRQSEAANSATPVVKAMMAGTNICLTGLHLIDQGSIEANFNKKWEHWKDRLDLSPEQLELIEECYTHKTDQHEIVHVRPFIERIRENREAIYRHFASAIDAATDRSPLPRSLTRAQRRKNKDGLDAILRRLYRLEHGPRTQHSTDRH